jgi:kynurenine formamidase
MILKASFLSREIEFNSEIYHSISIKQAFDSNQPNIYNVPFASRVAYKDEDFIGDVLQGGVCNFDLLTLVPHCNGTHTESIGHIVNYKDNNNNPIYSLPQILNDTFFTAKLISLKPIHFNDISDSYYPISDNNDLVITQSQIENIIEDGIEALIIRTLPNNTNKLNNNYSSIKSAFFTNEAMQAISNSSIKHLIVDLPSIDRARDNGKLSNHRIYWNVKEDSIEINTNSRTDRTISEFAFIDDFIEDGYYILNIETPPLLIDAVPSNIKLFPIKFF